MIELTRLEYELKRYVEAAYRGDEDLFNKYHVAKYTFEEAVEETLRMIYETSLEVEMSYFGVVEEGKIIGYLCTHPNNLYSFGINIHYRTKDVLSQFWEKIKEVLGVGFMTVLYPNNSRAIEWVKRCGMQTIDCVVLTYNN